MSGIVCFLRGQRTCFVHKASLVGTMHTLGASLCLVLIAGLFGWGGAHNDAQRSWCKPDVPSVHVEADPEGRYVSVAASEVAGIANVGNSCFMSTALQMLFNVLPLRQVKPDKGFLCSRARAACRACCWPRRRSSRRWAGSYAQCLSS